MYPYSFDHQIFLHCTAVSRQSSPSLINSSKPVQYPIHTRSKQASHMQRLRSTFAIAWDSAKVFMTSPISLSVLEQVHGLISLLHSSFFLTISCALFIESHRRIRNEMIPDQGITKLSENFFTDDLNSENALCNSQARDDHYMKLQASSMTLSDILSEDIYLSQVTVSVMSEQRSLTQSKHNMFISVSPGSFSYHFTLLTRHEMNGNNIWISKYLSCTNIIQTTSYWASSWTEDIHNSLQVCTQPDIWVPFCSEQE